MKKTIYIAVLALAIVGCRGMEKDWAIHPNLNMDFTERFEEQEANPFFADGRAMRPIPPGTVARGFLRDSTEFYFGRIGTVSGALVAQNPLPLTREVMARGQNQFNIYCAPCHSRVGDGQGVLSQYGYPAISSLHQDYLRTVEDGHLYEVITNGIRNMPSYAHQIRPRDRWAIVHYVRALQRSQNATAADVPAGELRRLQTENPNVTLGN